MAIKTGFARVDVTPNLGFPIDGYYYKRYAEGILDNLCATAVVFDDGEKKAVVISLDSIGVSQIKCDIIRKTVSEKTGIDYEGIYIACTHTHTGLGFGDVNPITKKEEEEMEFKNRVFDNTVSKICDAVALALEDLLPSKFSYCRQDLGDISFIRRYKMIDGSPCSHPDEYGKFVVGAFAEIDKSVQHLIIEREGGYNIGIVNFGVHPDAIGGAKISGDYPHFVRTTYEKLLDNTRCMFITGAQGDCNSRNVKLPMDHPMMKSYKKSQWMGRKIAMAAIANLEFAEPLNCDKISFMQKNVRVKYNKGTPEETEFALKMKKIYKETADVNAAIDFVSKEKNLPLQGAHPWIKPADYAMKRYNVIAALANAPEEKDLYVIGISLGDVVFAGFPGEIFTEVGRQVKKNDKFTLTMPTCCTNGAEGYFPTEDAFEEKGYEATTAVYIKGSAENLIETSLEIIKDL